MYGKPVHRTEGAELIFFLIFSIFQIVQQIRHSLTLCVFLFSFTETNVCLQICFAFYYLLHFVASSLVLPIICILKETGNKIKSTQSK